MSPTCKASGSVSRLWTSWSCHRSQNEGSRSRDWRLGLVISLRMKGLSLETVECERLGLVLGLRIKGLGLETVDGTVFSSVSE